jgi:ribosome-associated protein
VHSKKLATLAETALEDMKARDIRVIDVRKLTTVTDYMIVASGTSDRHVRSIADRVVERATAAGCEPLGMEGEEAGEWVLVDLQDVVVHILLGRVRDFYKLENLWDMQAPGAETAF